MNDEQIIARVLTGDADAYRDLVEKHERSVFGFVKGLVRNESDVEDLAQEVFVAAFKHLPTFDARRAKFSTWLLTIAHNRCCNHLFVGNNRRNGRPDVRVSVARRGGLKPRNVAPAR